MPGLNFIASVKEERIGDIDIIARNLEVLGCTIDNVLSFSGIITGIASPGLSLSDLKIDGIKHIEPDRRITASEK
jgi:hypothetical protein